MIDLTHQLEAVRRALMILPIAALLGAALGVIRPVRRGLIPRSSHVIQTQVLLSVVGALIIMVVAESLARAFAIVGIAGLVRYRARISDPKDASVLLVALSIGLIAGTGLFLLAAFACAFVILVLWLLESLEPATRTHFDLHIEARDALRVRPQIEHALRVRDVRYELRQSSPSELRYDVTVPFHKKLGRLTKLIRGLDKHDTIAVDWKTQKPKVQEA